MRERIPLTNQPVATDPSEVAVIHGGPLYEFFARIGLGHASGRTGHLCILFVAVTWLPMALLSFIQGAAINSDLKIPFLFDISEICRFLLCGPTLIIAEKVVEPWLRSVITHFRALVPSGEMRQFNHYLTLAARARDRVWVEILLLVFALSRPHFDSSVVQLHEVTSWQMIGETASFAHTYSLTIAKPLMGWLMLRWLWKYSIWSLLLVRISTLNLRLIPTHPDDTAGLGFVSVGQSKFGVLVGALALIIVGAIADQILYEGATLMSFRWLILSVVALCLVIFATPLLAFTPKLIECKRLGLFAYGSLAQEYVEAFDSKWIENRTACKEEILGHADLQSLADIENSYAVVQRMRVILIDKSFLLTFVLWATLPFSPLLLTMYQLDELFDRIFKNFL